MLLEKFNDYPWLIDVFQSKDNVKHSFVSELGGEKTVGVGDIMAGKLIYFYVSHGKLLLRCEETEIDLTSPGVSLNFSQHEDGVSVFKVNNKDNVVFSLTYDSWWKATSAAIPAGFGAAGDEEEDLLAYLTLMSQSEIRLQHLIRKYS